MNNNRKKIINMALIGAIITGGTAMTVGCDKKDEFSIVWNEALQDSLSLQPGESILLYAARDDEKAGTISYAITEGSAYATINSAGLLTVTKAAPVGQKIKVQAASDGVKSTEIVINVVAVKEIELTTTSSTTLERGDSATLNVNYKNSNDTVGNVTYKITAGSEHATLNNNVLTIDSDAADGATVTVMAETPITSTNTLTFTVNVPQTEIKYIIDADSTVTVDSTSTSNAVAIAPKVLDLDNSMQEVQLEATDLTYEVISGAEYVEVDASGYLTAIGHGQATIRVSYDSNDPLVATATKNITVNAILPPEAITLGKMFTYQLSNLDKTARLGFGVNTSNGDNAKLNLGIVGTHTETDHFADTYKVNVYVDGATTPSAGYANYNNADKSLTFTEMAIGRTLRVEVSTDTGASKETKVEFTVEVNDGYNIYDMDDLMQHKRGTNVTINLLADCVVTGNSDTVAGGKGISDYRLLYYGNTSIYGNGHKIDFSGVNNAYAGGGENFLHITNTHETNNNNVINEDYDVNIYDLSLYARNRYNEPFQGESVKVSPKEGSFDIAVFIEASSQDKVKDYVKGVTGAETQYHAYVNINNISINGFQTGLRVQYANSKEATSFTDAKISKISNIVVENCLESGIETVGSILTFENVKLGRLGTTGIETTPDTWWTAGENFDQPQKITFKGSYISENHNAFNNSYIENDEDLGVLPTIIKALASGLRQEDINIGGTTVDIAFEAFVIEKVKETAQSEGVDGVNLVSLLFNNMSIIDKITENPEGKAFYIRELVNGTILQFEDMQGESTNINNQLAKLSAELQKETPDMSVCQSLIMELFNSRFISLNVPTGEVVTSDILQKIGQLKTAELITEEDYNYLTEKLVEGADINIGSIIVENPLYGVYSAEDFAAVKSPAQLLAMIQVQTKVLG